MRYSAFNRGFDLVASGSLADVYSHGLGGAVIFDLETGRVVDVDPRFSPKEKAPKPGRPKLGVTAREVTLLPRHWDWLGSPPRGPRGGRRPPGGTARRPPRHP